MPLISNTSICGGPYNKEYINGGSVRSLHADTIQNSLFVGGEFDTITCFSSVTWSFTSAWQTPVLQWKTSPVEGYSYLSYYPASDNNPGGISNPSVWAVNTALNSFEDYVVFGGRFTYSGSFFPPPPPYQSDLHNIFFDPDYYLGAGLQSCSDTTFSVAMVPNAFCSVNPSLNFKTYIASRCALCDCNSPSTIDSTRFIAMYDPVQNCNLTLGVNYMQGGTNGPVYAIQAFDSANVYAAGRFDSAGTIKSANIAKWNGASWDSLGSGINGTVKCLLAHNGKIYAGGSFTLAGGNSASNIAVWDGASWSALGSGTNGTVYALTIHYGDLYAGGSFTQAGSTTVNYIARWTGSQWTSVGGGRNNEVYALASFQGDLYAGGNFTGGSSDTAKYIARYIDSTLSVKDEFFLSEVLIYPNPSDGTFIIKSPEMPITAIEIFNVLGKKIEVLTISSSDPLTVDLSGRSMGLYLVKIYFGDEYCFRKIVIR